MKRLLLLLLASSAFAAANASTITFSPSSQTVALGGTATVDVDIAGLSASQALGAFDLLVQTNSSILSPTGIVFFSSLGTPSMEVTGDTFSASSVEAAETSFETTSTLMGLQGSQPFSLFELTYNAIGYGTSSLTLGSNPEILTDGGGNILTTPTVVAGSITVLGGTPSPTPEPSSLVLLASGAGVLVTAVKRRRAVAE